MRVVANEYRKASRKYDAMVHSLDCRLTKDQDKPDRWREFDLEECRAYYRGRNVKKCTFCLGGGIL